MLAVSELTDVLGKRLSPEKNKGEKKKHFEQEGKKIKAGPKVSQEKHKEEEKLYKKHFFSCGLITCAGLNMSLL